jgi:hypothetical protein
MILADLADKDGLRVVGGVYDLATGKVELRCKLSDAWSQARAPPFAGSRACSRYGVEGN